MKKSDVFSDVKSDIDTKRVFKCVNEISHFLDQQRNRVRCTVDLFSNAIESHRARLCSYVEKLMFIAPLEHGRKCEEILWRKCFYDVYTSLKRMKKQEMWTKDEVSWLVNLLYSGIGFYQHLIMRLQEEFQLNLDGVEEFPMYKCNYGLMCHVFDKRSNTIENQSDTIKIKEWAKNCVHRSLLYIGDLNRYMFDFYPGWDISVAYRYYMKALYLKPEIGIPHNQLGTLSNSQNCTLDAAYRYLRCLYCKELFDGAEANLVAIMEQYPPIGLTYNNLPLKKRIFSQFLHLIGVWFLQKSPIKDVDQLCLEFVDNINVWFPEPGGTTSILKHDPTSLVELVETKCVRTFDLPENENTVFKVLVVFIICHHKLQQKQYKTGTSAIHSASTVIVAFISRTIEYVVKKLKETLPEPTPPIIGSKEDEEKNRKAKRRRRRRRICGTGSLTDDELSDCNLSENEDSDSDSEENLIFDESSDEEHLKSFNGTNGHPASNIQMNGIMNGHTKKFKKSNNTSKLIKFFQEQYHMMQVIKVSCDWLRCNKEVMSPISGWKAVFENFATLLNYSSVLVNNVNEVEIMFKENVPLPEDVELKELQALKIVQEKMSWQWKKIISLTLEQEMKRRLYHITEFGKFLSDLEKTIFLYDEERNWFNTITESEPIIKKETVKKLDDEQRGKLMKEMGQLWLEAEVKNLESKVKQTAKVNLLTPYLVVDSEALTQHCILVKKLVSSRQFVLLIPTAVVSDLDELKRTSGRARDAIRWLESQFRQGNRFLRMQRNNEKQSIPLVAYPRKKDNEAWLFMQIMECCYYLNNSARVTKTEDKAKIEEGSNFVRLLTGSRTLSNLTDVDVAIPNDKPLRQQPFNMAIVKKSTGLLIEHIGDFYGKWKDSTKSHG